MAPPRPLPCPFCASTELKTVVQDRDCYFVQCQDCQADGPPEETLGEAVQVWNAREIGAPPRDLIVQAAEAPARFTGPQGARSTAEWIADAIRIQLTSKLSR